MPNDLTFVLRNVQGFIKSIQEMDSSERQVQPLAQYGENFNSLLEQAKAVAPDVAEVHWPKPLEVYSSGPGRRLTRSSFAEISTYVRQIEGHLTAIAPYDESMPVPSPGPRDSPTPRRR